MKYKGYSGVVKLNEDSDGFFGRVVGLRDVITFQGTSIEEVTQAFHDSVDDYLELCAQRGEAPEKPYSGQFVLRLDPRLHRELANAAEARKTSLNGLIEETLEGVFLTSAGASKKRTRTRKHSSPESERHTALAAKRTKLASRGAEHTAPRTPPSAARSSPVRHEKKR
jgi:predicted HicB family RNase H-like nuclease